MAKGERGGKRGGGSAGGTAATAPRAAAIAEAPFTPFTESDAERFRAEHSDILSDPDVSRAINLYISDTDPNGDGFSHSQNLNFKLDQGKRLNREEKFIDDHIQDGMAPIGKNTNLQRFCHDDILVQCGIPDYTKLTDSQLQSRLVGMELETTSYLSASYDGKKSPFAPGAKLGGGREVVMNIKTKANTKVTLGESSQAEVIVNRGTKIRITGIHYDGSTARPRKTMRKQPRVVLDIETID